MFDMQVWQLAVIAIVAIVSLAWMSRSILRLTLSPASGQGTVRKATAIESALVGGVVPEGAQVFDGWAYRVGARFAGRVRIAVYSDRVAVAGPRVPRGLYQVWVWVQGLLLALFIPALVAAVVLLDWRWLVAAIGLFIASYGISFAGAGLWPGLGEILYDQGHPKALEFPASLLARWTSARAGQRVALKLFSFPTRPPSTRCLRDWPYPSLPGRAREEGPVRHRSVHQGLRPRVGRSAGIRGGRSSSLTILSCVITTESKPGAGVACP